MQYRINAAGQLFIKRGTRWQAQTCHLHACPPRGGHEKCSDRCPLFGEPRARQIAEDTIGQNYTVQFTNGHELTLCHARLFGECDDQRN